MGFTFMNEYHNPENIPESKIPQGWTFIPKDKFPLKTKQPCRSWLGAGHFSEDDDWNGDADWITYIIKQ